MADYTWAVDMAEEMIREYGREAVLVSLEPKTGASAWIEAKPVESKHDCMAVFTRYDEEYFEGTLVHAQDRVALVAAKGMGSFVPNLNGEIRVTNPDAAWKIRAVGKIQPAEQYILYRFLVRL